MARVVPTAADLKTRFVEFANVEDTYVEAVIAEARRHVDDTWTEDDYKPAIQYMAAHMMAAEGALQPAAVGVVAGAATGPIKAFSLGDASVTFGDRSNGYAGSGAELGSTVYGNRFLGLLRTNRGGPRVV